MRNSFCGSPYDILNEHKKYVKNNEILRNLVHENDDIWHVELNKYNVIQVIGELNPDIDYEKKGWIPPCPAYKYRFDPFCVYKIPSPFKDKGRSSYGELYLNNKTDEKRLTLISEQFEEKTDTTLPSHLKQMRGEGHSRIKRTQVTDADVYELTLRKPPEWEFNPREVKIPFKHGIYRPPFIDLNKFDSIEIMLLFQGESIWDVFNYAPNTSGKMGWCEPHKYKFSPKRKRIGSIRYYKCASYFARNVKKGVIVPYEKEIVVEGERVITSDETNICRDFGDTLNTTTFTFQHPWFERIKVGYVTTESI